MSLNAQESPEMATPGCEVELEISSSAADFIKLSKSIFKRAERAAMKDVLDRLEQKRGQVNEKVALYIADVQKSYDEYASTLLEDECGKTKVSSDGPCNVLDENRNDKIEKDETSSTMQLTLSKAKESEATATTHQESRNMDRSPVDDREMELAGFFTPHFLPLLEAKPPLRSSSYPTLTSATATGSTEQEPKVHFERAASVPLARTHPVRKSALRKEKNSKRRKRVSLSIDSGIVRPADEPQYESTPTTPTDDDVASMSPNATLVDESGTSMPVWLPETARELRPGEDSLDYLMAVGGVLHEPNDVQEHSTSLLPLVTAESEELDNHLNPSLDQNESIPTTSQERPNLLASRSDSSRTNFSPPTSPSLAIRAPPTYTDSFSTSSHRIHSPVEELPPKIAEVSHSFHEEGPSSSYVGGIGGSGVDAMDAGSIGYPSSLGASYMEQFAAARQFNAREPNSGLESSQEIAHPAIKSKSQKQQVVQDDDDEFLGEMEGI